MRVPAFLRSFFELLPSRIDQAIAGRTLRTFRVRRQRDRFGAAPAASDGQPRRLYIDVTVISRHDAGTGIQRVVRALALALVDEASPAWEVHFVAATRRRAYRHIAWPDAGRAVAPIAIEARPGDVFLGLDFSLDMIRRHRRQLAKFRLDGGGLWFLIYDLLPVERPEWFSPNNVIRYKAWLETIAGIANGLLSISQQTADDLKHVLADQYGLTGGYSTGIIPMGHAIMESVLQNAADISSAPSVRFDTTHPFLLMVGTLEPRKGHADILAAFNELWRQGSDYRLVLVGRQGWQVESLCNAIRNHPEHGAKLLWFDDVDDLELEQIYQACEGFIIASHAEGFGLPLIEALGHLKPVLARDLPVFRVHEDRGVHFFPANAEAGELGDHIRRWIGDILAGTVTVKPPVANWKKSAQAVLAILD